MIDSIECDCDYTNDCVVEQADEKFEEIKKRSGTENGSPIEEDRQDWFRFLIDDF